MVFQFKFRDDCFSIIKDLNFYRIENIFAIFHYLRYNIMNDSKATFEYIPLKAYFIKNIILFGREYKNTILVEYFHFKIKKLRMYKLFELEKYYDTYYDIETLASNMDDMKIDEFKNHAEFEFTMEDRLISHCIKI